MDGLTIKTFCLGELSSNCYLIFNQESKHAFMVDAPAPAEPVKDFIRKRGLELTFVALTHAHFDHIAGLNKLDYPFYLHQNDLRLLEDPAVNGSVLFGLSTVVRKEPRLYKDNEPLCFDDCPLEVIHTPGHTPGSVSLKLNNWLFSGDTLFLDSIGRTDIPLGSPDAIIKSVKERLLVLPGETIVYPGHGAPTSIERESSLNPFLS
jgi:glyoxylase-like metal-dependent hydrolase (beta-lactamase superfamily II)